MPIKGSTRDKLRCAFKQMRQSSGWYAQLGGWDGMSYAKKCEAEYAIGINGIPRWNEDDTIKYVPRIAGGDVPLELIWNGPDVEPILTILKECGVDFKWPGRSGTKPGLIDVFNSP